MFIFDPIGPKAVFVVCCKVIELCDKYQELGGEIFRNKPGLGMKFFQPHEIGTTIVWFNNENITAYTVLLF